uniref:KH domain-containing protein n=1 Tax=Syphacia muris TaxID=451379 RepID=A0A0N5AFX3_9BILA
MNEINTSVKSGIFNAQLANWIYVLCQQLKTSGQLLEQTHKNELNRVFVSLRQACCRDNGQLGTPCRLKMMEIIELRAMGWRPNLAHSQYYLNRLEQQSQYAPPPPLYVSGDISNPQIITPQPNPTSFYLIPATVNSGGWGRPLLTPGVLSAGSLVPQVTALDMENWGKNNKGQASKMKIKVSQNKVPEYREEMVIRNSDSGKIMGVKGRRVAVVEELSKTIISFQKVDQKSKDRTLTITGNSQESIDHAKRLIEQTIRRNISPCRVCYLRILNLYKLTFQENNVPDKSDDDDLGISIETTRDGILKLSCADPQVLQAAQAALSEYLNQAGRSRAKMSAAERELRKERRKSMPLSPPTSTSAPHKEWRSTGKTGSTPNLAQLNSSKVTRYSREDMLKMRSAAGSLDTKTIKFIEELDITRHKRNEATNSYCG